MKRCRTLKNNVTGRTMKRCRSLKNNVTGRLVVDRISSLQEHLLTQILSLLPTKEAVCTSILSRRWRRVYSWLTNLEFDASPLPPQNSCFITHVDTVLRVCHSVNLTRFCLKLGKDYDNLFDLELAHLYAWISFPLTRSVKEIDLCIHVKQPGKLPPEIFSLDMLEVLKIDSNLELETPRLFGLINLKTLQLRKVTIPDGSFLTGILSKCSSLVELEVKGCNCGDSPVLKISHHLLKKLYLDMPPVRLLKTRVYVLGVGLEHEIVPDNYQRTDVVLDTPNLQYLYYADNMALRYSAGNLNSLTEASIYINERLDYEDTYFKSMLSLLSLLANIRSLSLIDSSYSDASGVELKKTLVLPNLIHLQLSIEDFSYCLVLLDLLYCSPLLERLTLSDGVGLRSDDFVEPCVYARLTSELESANQTIPCCLKSRLKKIQVNTYRPFDEDFLLVKYFLRSAAVLQELEVNCLPCVDITQTEIALKNLPRESMNCSIKVQRQNW